MSYQEREQKHLQTVLLTAMMMAIILVLTYLVRIPAVATRGYIHLGDAAIFLAVLSTVPSVLTVWRSVSIPFGASSILIAVSVALESMQQIEAQLTMRHYKGFLQN